MTTNDGSFPDLVREGLDYFYKSGDAGDREYVAAIRAHIRILSAIADEYSDLIRHMDAGGDFYEFMDRVATKNEEKSRKIT